MEAMKRGGGLRGTIYRVAQTALFLCAAQAATAQIADHVVISEVYGGGGNAGATYKCDFIELYNPLDTAVVMTDWSVQYASATGAFGSHMTVVSGRIPPHGYFLIQEARGGAGTMDLPAPDDSGIIAMSAASGKVALAADTVAVAGPGGPSVVDFVGYGSANAWEGTAAAPSLSSLTCAERKGRGNSTASSMALGGADSLKGNGWDAGDNAADFVERRVQGPQNSRADLEDTLSGDLLSGRYPAGVGWNMLSVPLGGVADLRASALFPAAGSEAFCYEGTYVARETLRTGIGYWLRFPADTAAFISGTTRGAASIPVGEGWNLIGTVSAGLPVANVSSDPPGIIVSKFFGFSGSYSAAEVLAPCRGYWVKASAPGVLFLVAPAPAAPGSEP